MKDRLITFNVNGLRNPTKRKLCFQYLKRHRANIIFLQETHCSSQIETESWTKEWAGDGIWNNYKSNSRGTAILWKSNSEFQIKNLSSTHEGRTIIALLTRNKENILLINVYAPNTARERKLYFSTLAKQIDKLSSDYETDSIILGGDFNCVLDHSKDKISPSGIHNDSSVKEIKNMMNHFNLIDAWRRLNPNDLQYTWHKLCKNKPHLNISVRLDRWLISDKIFPEAKNCEILSCAISDHSPVVLSMETLEGIKRGKGTWKFNNDLLTSNEFKGEISDMWKLWQNKKLHFNDISEWWEKGKEMLKYYAIEYSIYRNKLNHSNHRALEQKLQNAIKSVNKGVDISDKVNRIKEQLKHLELTQVRG